MQGIRHLMTTIVAGACLAQTPGIGQAQDVDSFYKGRQISMYIGSDVGGGYDADARLVGRDIGEYIQGNTTGVALDMHRARGNIARGYIYHNHKDGTTIAAIPPGAITKPIYAESNVRYDFTKLVYLGSANTEVNLCWVRNDAPVRNFEDLLSKELVIGASGEGD